MLPGVLVPVSLLHHVFGGESAARRAFAFAASEARLLQLASTLSATPSSPLLLAPPASLSSPLRAAAAACASADAARLAEEVRALSGALVAHAAAHRSPFTAARASAAGAEAAAASGSALTRALLLGASLRLIAASALGRGGGGGGGSGSGGGGASDDGELRPRAGVSLAALARAGAEDVRAFCVEKFGAAPEVLVDAGGGGGGGGGERTLVGVPALLRFALAELLKNSLRATLARFSPAGADDAPPVRVRLRADARLLHLEVEDSGCGLAGLALPAEEGGGGGGVGGGAAFPLFLEDARAARAREEIDYKYSREFGAPFSGLGLGLARADVYARLHGGRLSLRAAAGGLTVAGFSLRRDGSATDVEALDGL